MVHRELFIRRCYVDLGVVIKLWGEYMNLVICGDPGIGKSSFALYVFPLLKQAGFKVVWVSESGSIIYFDGSTVINDLGSSPNVWLDDDGWLLLDGKVDAKYLDKTSKTVVFASPKRDNYYTFLKVSDAEILFMPPWSLNEVNTMIDKMTDSILALEYSKD